MPRRKNLGKLIPVKRHVTDRNTGKTHDRTYYIDPNKDKRKDKRTAKSEDATDANTKAKGDTPTKTDPSNNVAPDGKLRTKKKDNKDALDSVKDFEDFGKHDIDPVAAKQFFCNM